MEPGNLPLHEFFGLDKPYPPPQLLDWDRSKEDQEGGYWYCEYDDGDGSCGTDINTHRFQCAGCGLWFCFEHSHHFVTSPEGERFSRVCLCCYRIWLNLTAFRGIPHTIRGEGVEV